MNKVGGLEEDQVLRIAVMGDSHGNYKDLDRTIAAINEVHDVDFTVHLGDLTNSSYNFEYDQFLSSYAKLHTTKFMVIGNHDALGAGPSLFRKAFGPSNYWFETEHVRFVFWNGVGLEDPDSFDPDWLVSAVSETSKAVVVFTHVPLDDHERFSGATKDKLESVIHHPNVQAVLNGHNHVYMLQAGEGTRFIQSPRVEGVKWILVEIKIDGFHITQSQKAESTWVSFKN